VSEQLEKSDAKCSLSDSHDTCAIDGAGERLFFFSRSFLYMCGRGSIRPQSNLM